MSTFTRKDYLAGVCTHSQYYRQMVTPTVLAAVENRFGRDVLAQAFEAGNTSFNSPDFCLGDWDCVGLSVSREAFKQYGDFHTVAGAVCVVKEAGRMLATGEA